MQAMNGSAVRRKRGRLIGCCMTLALALSGLVLAPAAANAETTTYIATGDSITFGYTQEKFNVNFPNEAPAYFEEGFDHFFAKSLNLATEVGKGLIDVNSACPGETSNGYIGENELIGGQKSTEPSVPPGEIQGLGDWHPCAYHQVDGFALHYSLGTHSQLEEVLSILKEGKAAHPVRAITLNIGSNDELAAIKQCEDEVAVEFGTTGKSKYGASPSVAVITCITETSEKVTVPHILNNLGTIITVLEESGYTGPIVLLGFYNPDTFILPGSDALQAGTNAAVEANIVNNPAFKGQVTFANPFPVFNAGSASIPGKKASAPKEKEAICKYTEMCNPNDPGGSEGKGDIHPTIKGYKALAKLVNAAYLANPAK
jgi:lysophospholipase L1-like esterase